MDLERARAAIAGMTATPWRSSGPVHAGKGQGSVLVESAEHYIARMFTINGPMGCNSRAPEESLENAEGIAILRNAQEIRMRRTWWTEWIGQEWVVVCSNGHVLGDDGRLFTGPDPDTPLLEADEYYQERDK